MANRTTVKSNIISQNVPTVTNAILTGMLNTQLADNLRFREDVAVVQASGVSAITVDFVGKDRVDLTRTGGSLAISATGIDDGETKFLLVNKTAGQAVAFVGITDITPVKVNADALPLVLYEIVRKGANYFAKAWVDTVSSEVAALYNSIVVTNALIVSNKLELGGLKTIMINIDFWNMDITSYKLVAHGLTVSKIRAYNAFITNDSGWTYPIDFCNIEAGGEHSDGSIYLVGSYLRIDRRNGGKFDNQNFTGAGNRGWIVIQYLP